MILDELLENELNDCREVINKDVKLREIDTVFYDLLDEADDTIKMKLEDAYIEYGVRAIFLAYLQGLKDFCRLCDDSSQDRRIEELKKALLEN